VGTTLFFGKDFKINLRIEKDISKLTLGILFAILQNKDSLN
jgi:hypothetical protein